MIKLIFINLFCVQITNKQTIGSVIDSVYINDGTYGLFLSYLNGNKADIYDFYHPFYCFMGSFAKFLKKNNF